MRGSRPVGCDGPTVVLQLHGVQPGAAARERRERDGAVEAVGGGAQLGEMRQNLNTLETGQPIVRDVEQLQPRHAAQPRRLEPRQTVVVQLERAQQGQLERREHPEQVVLEL
jgi:hypothetical protein